MTGVIRVQSEILVVYAYTYIGIIIVLICHKILE